MVSHIQTSRPIYVPQKDRKVVDHYFRFDFTNLDLFWGVLSCHITSIVPVTPSMKSSRHKYSVTSRSCCSSSCGWASLELGGDDIDEPGVTLLCTSVYIRTLCFMEWDQPRHLTCHAWDETLLSLVGSNIDHKMGLQLIWGMGSNEQPSVEWAP